MEEQPSLESPPARRRSWRLPTFLLFLLLLAAGGWFLWLQVDDTLAALHAQDASTQRLFHEIAALKNGAARLEVRQTDLSTANEHAGEQVASFAQRLDAHDQLVGRLNEQVAGGRQRFQLAAVEELLLLANDRVQLARDPQSALAALDAADQRLAALADPRLFNVRAALAQERAALAAVPQPDLAAAGLALSSVIDRVPRLPLAARVPERFEGQALDATEAAPDASWWERAKASIGHALKGTFSVRRNRGPVPQLLTADQETLVFQVLELKLEAARVALLRGDSPAMRDALESARRWLDEYFRKDDPGVLAAQAALERLLPLELAPALPDLTRSLTLLRAQLEPAPQ